MKKKDIDLSLYLVTDSRMLAGRSLEAVVEEAVKGGVTVVQLREKDSSTRSFVDLAIRLKNCLKQYNVPLLINDRIDVALACDADGIHIGNSDMPYQIARAILGKDKVIGLSVESVEDAIAANALDVDYLGISPVFSTLTKNDIAKPLELSGVEQITKLSHHPCVGIGGLNKNNIADVLKYGAKGVCVVSAIMASENPLASAKELREIIDNSDK